MRAKKLKPYFLTHTVLRALESQHPHKHVLRNFLTLLLECDKNGVMCLSDTTADVKVIGILQSAELLHAYKTGGIEYIVIQDVTLYCDITGKAFYLPTKYPAPPPNLSTRQVNSPAQNMVNSPVNSPNHTTSQTLTGEFTNNFKNLSDSVGEFTSKTQVNSPDAQKNDSLYISINNNNIYNSTKNQTPDSVPIQSVSQTPKKKPRQKSKPPDTEQDSIHAPPKDLNEVLECAEYNSISLDVAEKFYYHFQSTNWLDANNRRFQWKYRLLSWGKDRRNNYTRKSSSISGISDFSGDTSGFTNSHSPSIEQNQGIAVGEEFGNGISD